MCVLLLTLHITHEPHPTTSPASRFLHGHDDDASGIYGPFDKFVPVLKKSGEYVLLAEDEYKRLKVHRTKREGDDTCRECVCFCVCHPSIHACMHGSLSHPTARTPHARRQSTPRQGEGKIVGRDFVVDYQGDSAPEAVTEPEAPDSDKVKGGLCVYVYMAEEVGIDSFDSCHDNPSNPFTHANPGGGRGCGEQVDAGRRRGPAGGRGGRRAPLDSLAHIRTAREGGRERE